jgi:hypothetical protein
MEIGGIVKNQVRKKTGRPPKNPQAKPIALICDSFQHALDWVMHNHEDVQEYAKHRSIIVADGIEYVTITRPEHLYGIEISDYMVPSRIWHIPNLADMIALAKTRIR